ncbi:MAG: class I SAM-dependent methyltransferase [Lachnospiraceae bacterium]|nr:class I SAM-dependent methyltransferase [Lachnospiraceae bacterium]
MESYTSFARVYDLFMDNVPYEEWCEYLTTLLKENGIEDGLILDLGCGTGKLTRLMEQKGYDMIGVDNSFEMLDIAREQDSENILYLMQDMREFELYGTVRAVYSACDSVNYILEEEELLEVFKLVNNYLDPGGLFIFDINSSFKYHELLAENTFAETREEGSFIWENYFDEEEGINEYDLTLYIEEEDGRFARFQEMHYQKCYELNTIKKLIEAAGLEFVVAYDAYTKNPVAEDSEKITIVARECTK